MMDYISTKDVAKKWGISARRVAILCTENRVDGVVKVGNTWLISKYAAKPKEKKRGKKPELNNP